MVEELKDEFISHEPRKFKYTLGRVVASSLTGFLAGIIVASIFFITLSSIASK